MKHLGSAQVRDMLRIACNGNQALWAAKHKLSAAYVSDVLNKRKDPGESIARALGLTKVIRYIDQADA